MKSLLRNHGVSCIISKHFCINSLSRREHPYEMQKHSAIVVGAIAVRVEGFNKNQFKKRDIYTQDTGEKRRA